MCRAARLRLVPLPHAHAPFRWAPPDAPGSEQSLHALQLRINFMVLPPVKDVGRMLDGIISTGEPLSIFPKDVWEEAAVADYIEWLSPEHVYGPNVPVGPVPNYPGPNALVFRDRCRFRLGRVRVVAYDDDTPRDRPPYGVLHPSHVVARFLIDDAPDIREPVFGLQGSILNNRRLAREPSWDHTTGRYRQTWWLEEVI